jgi:lysophospholipase L1-like esterase
LVRVRLAILGVALVASVLGLEGALRIVHPHGMLGTLDAQPIYPWLAFDPLLSWRNRPGWQDPAREGLVIDRRGLRPTGGSSAGGPSSGAPAEGAHSLRVLCVGDSRTFGTWLDQGRFGDDGDYARPLRALLERAAPATAVEVLNAGTIGYTAAQGLRQWLTDLERTSPDVLIVSYGMNEHLAAWNPSFRVREPSSPVTRRLLYRFGRWRLVEAGYWLARRGFGDDRGPDGSAWSTPEAYEQTLERWVDEAAGRERNLLLLDIPLCPLELGEDVAAFPGDPGIDWGLLLAKDLADFHRIHAVYTERMLELARRRDVPVLRLEATFDSHRKLRPGSELFSVYDFVHPNRQGARVIAEAVVAELERRGWVDGGDPSPPALSAVPPAAPPAARADTGAAAGPEVVP